MLRHLRPQGVERLPHLGPNGVKGLAHLRHQSLKRLLHLRHQGLKRLLHLRQQARTDAKGPLAESRKAACPAATLPEALPPLPDSA